MPTFTKRTRLAVSADTAFAWHERPGAFERLLPPWDRVRIASMRGGIAPGARAELDVRLAPGIWKRWVAEHRDFEPGRLFRDVQISGPFASWDHHHTFEPIDAFSSVLHDRIDYQPPGGSLGRLLGAGFIQRKLERTFAFRHAVTAADLEHHARYASCPHMRVLVSGSSGMIGRATCALLTTGGHTIARLVRPPRMPKEGEILWNPDQSEIDINAVAAFKPDAVLHLAGESIVGRWNAQKLARVRASRLSGTSLLARTAAALAQPPAAFLSASGTSIYGHTGETRIDEAGAHGRGFLAELAHDWEAATSPAREAGIRSVQLRIGWVLTPQGGALGEILPFAHLGLSAIIGDGRPYIPWISLDDCAATIHHALANNSIFGPVNLCAANSVSNAEFMRTLGSVLHRPVLLRCPAWAARMAFGQLADESLLSGQNVRPRVLEESGFVFRHPHLHEALAHVLGKSANGMAPSTR